MKSNEKKRVTRHRARQSLLSIESAGKYHSAQKTLKERVRESWNALSWVYRPPRAAADYFGHLESDYAEWLGPMIRGLPRGAKVLDLGCGTGVPTSRVLSRQFRVAGVDISDTMVRRARQLVPQARFLRSDMMDVRFPSREFSGVVAFYSIIHVPLSEQRPLFRRIRDWLRPNGWFLAVLGRGAFEGWEKDWLGSSVEMFWSHADAGTYRRWLASAGFRIIEQKFVPEGEGGHELFLARAGARKPS